MSKFKSIISTKTDDELTDILLNSQDYQEEFIKEVENELTQRKIPVESIKNISRQAAEISNDTIRLGEQGNPIWITILFISALLGGLIPIIGGCIYCFSKRRTTSGEEVYTYNEQTRKYGKWMTIIGVVFILIYTFIRFPELLKISL